MARPYGMATGADLVESRNALSTPRNLQRGRRDDVYWAFKEIAEIHQQTTEIEQATAGFQLDQEVDVTAAVRITAGHRSEHANIENAVTLGDLRRWNPDGCVAR